MVSSTQKNHLKNVYQEAATSKLLSALEHAEAAQIKLKKTEENLLKIFKVNGLELK